MSCTTPPAPLPVHAGLSAEVDLSSVLQRLGEDAACGEIAGAVLAVAHGDRVACLEAVGARDAAVHAPMAVDTVFPIASMTKPITSACILLLAERGRLNLDDPLSRYVGAARDWKVGVTNKGELRSEPLQREVTLYDLLRHMGGLVYGPFGNGAVHALWREAGLLDAQQSNAQMMAKLAGLPLAHQPGTVFEYSMATDVLGHVLELVCGSELQQVFETLLTGPLGMSDTRFRLDAGQAQRLAQPLADKATGRRPAAPYEPGHAPRWQSGGGGLFSTAPDYLRFARMLQAGGRHEGSPLMARHSVALMTADHLPPDVRFGAYQEAFGSLAPMPGMGNGFGLGVGVRVSPGRNALPGSVGDFFWAGTTGTYFWVDPAEQLSVVLMMNAPLQRVHYRSLIRQLVYQALA